MQFKHIAARLTAVALLVSTLIVPASALTGTVSTGSSPLRMRSEANTSAAILKNLSNGTQVEILNKLDNGWYQIEYEGTTGYVSGDYISLGYVQVVDGPLNIRSGPGTSYDKVGSLSVGKVVEIIGQSEGWYQISSGYISADYVTEVDASQAQQAEASYVRVVEGPLNVRSGPGTDYDKVGSLSTGKVVEVKGLTNGWYQTSTGYICADYVTQADASDLTASSKGQEIANCALQYVGCRYVYGGRSPSGFDCSGLTSYVYQQCGYSINRTASGQLDNGRAVSKGELQPGDLVMFKNGGSSRASHVGIYIGGNQFVHAANASKGVVISSLSSSYYSSCYIGARRVVD